MSIRPLLDAIESRHATIGVIGLGYVGLPLVLLFSRAGFRVVGFDVDCRKIDALRRGESYIRHIESQRVAAAFSSGCAEATDDYARLAQCDAILICVPTPLGPGREPDLQCIRATADAIARHLRKGQLVVLESTTYPGTTREELLPRFGARGLGCGSDFFLAFSPERADPGNAQFHVGNIPKVVGGIDAPSLEAAVALYGAVVERVVPVGSTEIAESSKLLENVFRSVNIALVNELKVLFERMGIDIWKVIAAASTKPFGFMPFYPGPGLGGHCIPLDPVYLRWKAAEHGVPARFIDLAGEVNAGMPRYVVARTVEALERCGTSIAGAKVLVLGVAYKPNIEDHRESPSFALIELLGQHGADVSYCDPYLETSVPCSAEEFAKYDAILLSTPHDEFRDAALYRNAHLVIDTRNAVPAAELPDVPIVRA